MTINYIADQLYNISVAGYFNGEKFTRKEFRTFLAMNLRNCKAFRFEVALLDGRWLCEVRRYADTADGFDYYVPDSRDAEAELWHRFLAH